MPDAPKSMATAAAPSADAASERSASLSRAARVPGQRTRAPRVAEGATMTTQQLERFSPELLSIISHELRGPLAAIKGYAATLRRVEHRLSPAERKEFFDPIDE